MEMKRMTPKVLVVALALAGSAIVGSQAASAAAAAPTIVLSGGSTIFGLDPAIIVATTSTAGNVAFSIGTTVIKGCEVVATTTATPFVAKCSWIPAASGSTTLNATITPTDTANFTS